MPTFATGNTQWDQNLSTLGNALFPDPSKAGEAFYYGAKAREAQVDTSKKLDQMNSGNLATGYLASGNRPALNLQQGPGGAAILQGPDASNAAPLPPPLMTSNVGPQVSGAAGYAPGSGFGPGTPQPVLPNPTNPAANQAIIGALTDKAQSGPNPDLTGSDGSRAQNSYGYGPVPAGTVAPPGGGVRQAPNARADGSPDLAKLDFGLLFNLGVRAGQPADAVAANLRAVLATGRANGQISQMDAEQQAALLGEASMRNAAIQAASAANVEGIRQRGETQRTGMALQPITRPGEPGVTDFVPLSQVQGLGGRAGMTPAAVNEAVKPVETAPGGPGTAPVSMTQQQAQATGTPLYQGPIELKRQEQRGQPGLYYHPSNPTQLLQRDADQAAREGLLPATPSKDVGEATVSSAIINAPADQAADIRNRQMNVNAALTPKVADAAETARKQFQIDQALSHAFPLPTGGTMHLAGRNTDPATSSPELSMTLSNLADQYFQNSTDRSIRGNETGATNAAYQQLVRMKMIDPNQSRARSLNPSDPSTYIHKPVLDKQGNPTGVTKQYFRVDLLDPVTKKAVSAGQAPVIKMDQPMSSLVPGTRPAAPPPSAPYGTRPPAAAAPAGPAAAPVAPGTDGGPVPPGTQEGHTGKGNGGQVWIARGGRWIAR